MLECAPTSSLLGIAKFIDSNPSALTAICQIWRYGRETENRSGDRRNELREMRVHVKAALADIEGVDVKQLPSEPQTWSRPVAGRRSSLIQAVGGQADEPGVIRQ